MATTHGLERHSGADWDRVRTRLEMTWGDQPGILGFLSSVDHKRVGHRYFVTGFLFLIIGGIEALIFRTQLAQPNAGVVSAEVYNQLFTMHGTTMMLLFALPAESAFGNYFLPLMVGARDMAFPRLNMLSYWVFLLAGLFIHASFFVGQVPEGGWFAYVPLSLSDYLPNLGMDFYAIGVTFLGVSSTAGAINFLVTTFKMRAPGMTVSRIPVFAWAMVAISFMILFSFPAFTVAPLFMEFSRAFDMRFFEPAFGGDPLLWQHLFWFWGHPIVYILLLPSTGIVSMVVATFSGRKLVGYAWIVAALLSTAFISFGLWVHHMFVAGIPNLTTTFFSAVSLLVVIPSGIQFFAWLATMFSGTVRWDSPMLWAVGEMFTFLLGGITGVMVGVVQFDQLAHDSYFVVGHFHYVLAGAVVFGLMAGFHLWMPKVTGRMLHEGFAKFTFWLSFIGMNLTFGPMHILGLWGMARRTYTYEEGLGWGLLNLLETIGSFLFGIGLVLVFVNLAWSRKFGQPAPPNPWNGGTLEWATPSPTPTYNFVVSPIVDDRNPVWAAQARAERGEDGPGVLPEDPELALANPELEHELFTTAGPEGGLEKVMEMPGPSYAPLFVAISLLLLSTAMLVRSAVFAGAATLLLIASVVGWYWPKEESP